MKRFSAIVVCVPLLIFALHPLPLCAQGTLTPPGTPAPMMKTLAQIEARTPVDATNTPGNGSQQFTITQPGSYYLTGNVTGVNGEYGISIQTNDVTLDLNGFQMAGVSGSLYAIVIGTGQNVVIRNGSLRHWSIGVETLNGYCELEHLRVYDCQSYGFFLTDHCAVRNCSAVSNGYTGMVIGNGCAVADCQLSFNASNGITSSGTCTFKNCAVSRNGATGIAIGNGCALTDCLISSNATGIYAGSDCVISGCQSGYNQDDGVDLTDNFNISRSTAKSNGGTGFNLGANGIVNSCTAIGNQSVEDSGNPGGIVVNNNCIINNCNASGNYTYGIQVMGDNCTINNCNATGNGDIGIGVYRNNCKITGNNCSENYVGIEVQGRGNQIDNNTFGNCGAYGIDDEYSPVNAGNSITRNSAPSNSIVGYNGYHDWAPIQTPALATNPWANF